MSWQGYRNSKLGNSLVEALDKFITEGKLEPEQADIILQQYDKSTAKFLGKSNVKATLKGDLHTYRYAEDREPNAFIFFLPFSLHLFPLSASSSKLLSFSSKALQRRKIRDFSHLIFSLLL